MGGVGTRRAFAVVAGIVGGCAGFVLVTIGGFYAATVGETRAAAADVRTGAILVVAGTLTAVATPLTLAIRTRRWWHWLVVVVVLAAIAYWIGRWPPVIDWTF